MTRSAPGGRAQAASNEAARRSRRRIEIGDRGIRESGGRGWGEMATGSGPELGQPSQRLEHQLVPHVGVVEIGHATFVAHRPGAIVALFVYGFEVGEDAVAGAHGKGARGLGAREPVGRWGVYSCL